MRCIKHRWNRMLEADRGTEAVYRCLKCQSRASANELKATNAEIVAGISLIISIVALFV